MSWTVLLQISNIHQNHPVPCTDSRGRDSDPHKAVRKSQVDVEPGKMVCSAESLELDGFYSILNTTFPRTGNGRAQEFGAAVAEEVEACVKGLNWKSNVDFPLATLKECQWFFSRKKA